MNTDDRRDPELELERENEPDRHWFRPFLLILLAAAVLALFIRPALPGAAGSGGSGGESTGTGGGAAGTAAAEAGKGGEGADVSLETAPVVPAAEPGAAHAPVSAPVLQWESDRPATDTEERVYRLACLYLGNAVADGGRIRFPAFGAPGTSIRKAANGYEVAGFFRIDGKEGRFADYRYTLVIDEHIVSVLNSSTTRMEAEP